MGSMKMTTVHHLNLLWRFDRGLSLKEVVFASVKPGDVVIDAGCGTGILSVWAAKAGARKVLAIDSGDISIAMGMAEENCVADQIEFVQSDLTEFEMPKNERADVLLGMLYFNDPRRDLAQTELSNRLRGKLLRTGGVQVPDRVMYGGCPLEWPEQDINTHYADVDKKLDIIEQKYDLTLNALRDTTKQVPDPAWFPARESSGLLKRERARTLSSEKSVFVDVDYEKGFFGYPNELQCRVTQPGICNVLLFTQYLCAAGRALFVNESISWVRNPMFVEAGTEVRFAFDDSWFDTSIVSMSIAGS